jgi:hypothetical protein
LAHGLFDPESWLGQYQREAAMKHRQQATSSTSTQPKLDPPSSSRFRYNVSEPIRIDIPHTDVHIQLHIHGHIPASAHADLQTSTYPSSHQQSNCETALILLKYIAEMGYRPNDLSRAALQAYMQHDYWTALEYYDELSELGLPTAQENAVFVYKQLKKAECSSRHRRVAGDANGTSANNTLSSRYWQLLKQTSFLTEEPVDINEQTLEELLEAYDEYNVDPAAIYDVHAQSVLSPEDDQMLEQDGDDRLAQVVDKETVSSPGKKNKREYVKMLPEDISLQDCEYYFDRMIANRWLQRASLGGREAFRELALLSASSRKRAVTTEALQGGNQSRSDEGDIQSPIEASPLLEAQLYGLAAAMGDAQALVGLGWLLRSGGDGGTN